ncbi:MAG TPA: FAD-dependent thymidylate synthase [Alkalispirochaeta sp.]|nr:FAD-dependent thymidylate synthase [Alkalispirochaeta sp.]
MAHEHIPAAEEILDQEFPVLDKGFVRLVDYLGGDQRIVQSARVSYGAGTKTYRQDKGLINYLLRNEHTSPFEQVIFTFHTKMPVFVARQWVRHRTARLNEISGRYSVMKDEFYVPAEGAVAPQSTDNKQGRSGDAFDPEQARAIQAELSGQQQGAYREYEALLERNVARELARINLPLSMYTEWYWQIDLHNLLHFLKLRMDSHAQYEIRAYAEVMFEIAQRVCPIATEAFDEHVRGGVSFSTSEFAVLQELLAGGEAGEAGAGAADAAGSLEERVRAAGEHHGVEGRALDRLLDKLRDGRSG